MTKRAWRVSLIGVLALAMTLLSGAAAGAQDQVIIEDTGELLNTGEVSLQIGDVCFVEETVAVQSEVLSPDYPTPSTSFIVSSETLLVEVPCEDEPDEVLGIVEEPDEVLAFSGSEINRPVSLGFALVGAGGLLLYVAKRSDARREDVESAEI